MQPSNFIKALKELGVYLGSKLDTLSSSIKNNPQNIRVDLGDATKRMEATALSTGQLLSAMNEFIKSEKQSRGQTLEIITSVQQTVASQVRALASTDATGKLTEVIVVLSKLSELLEKKKFDYSEQKKTNTLVANLIEVVKKIKIKERDVDFSSLEQAIHEIKIPKTISIEESFYEKMNSVVKVLSSIKFPATFKLDDMQYRGLSTPTVTGGATVSTLTATQVRLANVTMTTADTEYSYTFPSNTLSWELKLRSQNVLLYYSFTAGTLKVSGDGSLYGTIAQNFLRSKDSVEWSGKTIYLETGSAAQVCEITIYTA